MNDAKQMTTMTTITIRIADFGFGKSFSSIPPSVVLWATYMNRGGLLLYKDFTPPECSFFTINNLAGICFFFIKNHFAT